MTEVIQCKDLLPGCDFTAEAETEEELLQEAAEHATAAHGITQLTDDIVANVRGIIRDKSS